MSDSLQVNSGWKSFVGVRNLFAWWKWCREEYRLAIVLHWALLFLIVSIAVFAESDRTVANQYDMAAKKWINGQSMYDESGHGFLYLPHAAILFVPFSLIPAPWGHFAWRACGLVFLAVGVRRVSSLLGKPAWAVHWCAAAVAMLMCVSSLRIGQSTLAMTGIMLLAVESLYQRRFFKTTAWLALGIAVKPLVIVLVLLVFAMERRTRLPLLAAAILISVAPFAFQAPSYVFSQYADCLNMLRIAAELGNKEWWAQVFGMIRTVGIQVPGEWQTITRLVAALCTLAIVFVAFRKFARRRAFIWLFTMTVVYLMLFNPRTENSTYCLLGPAIGLFLAEELAVRKNWAVGGFLWVLAVLTTGSHEIGKHLTPVDAKPIWLAPLCCCAFAFYLSHRFRLELKHSARIDSNIDLAGEIRIGPGHHRTGDGLEHADAA